MMAFIRFLLLNTIGWISYSDFGNPISSDVKCTLDTGECANHQGLGRSQTLDPSILVQKARSGRNCTHGPGRGP